eukprot:scaffold12700_cov142-Skeletonema_menzelii.AAC.6
MNSFLLFKFKFTHRILGVTVAIMLAGASLLFAKGHRNIKLSSEHKATHIQNHSSSDSTLEMLMSHDVSRGYQEQTADENNIKISSTPNEPVFVLHIGPHKTATSTIQCDLTRYRKELYESASVAFMGRIYSSCFKRRYNEYTFNPRLLIDSCFKNGNCKAKDAWKSLESQLQYLSAHNKHVILSDEAFARMHVTSRNQEDNRKMLFDLINKYYPGRMRVVVVYRRYYEWQLSLWNQFNKPFFNGNGDTSGYKESYRKWPSEGGKRCQTFQSFLEELLDPENARHCPSDKEYRNRAEASHVHAAQYFRGLWSNHSSEVQVLNLHKMNVPTDNGEDVTSRFLQSTLTPLAAETYIRSKDSGFGGRHNPSRNINYDILAVVAHEHGLLANQTIPRAQVAALLEENLMKFKNTTDLPLQCPNEELLKRFLLKSLHYEELLYPSQSDETEHEMNFYEAAKKHKFCNFDFDALLEDEDIRAFFAEEIPRLYRHYLKH